MPKIEAMVAPLIGVEHHNDIVPRVIAHKGLEFKTIHWPNVSKVYGEHRVPLKDLIGLYFTRLELIYEVHNVKLPYLSLLEGILLKLELLGVSLDDTQLWKRVIPQVNTKKHSISDAHLGLHITYKHLNLVLNLVK